MGLFGKIRRKDIKTTSTTTTSSTHSSTNEEHIPHPQEPFPDAKQDVLGASNNVICTVREPWQWAVKEVGKGIAHFSVVESLSDLPTRKLEMAMGGRTNPQEDSTGAPSTPSVRRRRKKLPGPCTLRLEVYNPNGVILDAVHGSSEAFDGLEDKDELLRTLQRCRCEHLGFSPPSRLLNWDVTKEECFNLVGDSLPTLPGNGNLESVAVLKEPMGRSGTGVFFVRNPQEIHEIIEAHRKQAVEEEGVLDKLIATKGRIPSWVLQAEVHPCLLIRDKRKFHIRTYLVCIENFDRDDLVEMYIYNRHEIRIASEPVATHDNGRDDAAGERNRNAHITNASVAGKDGRSLLHEEPQLKRRNLQEKVEQFVAELFSKHLIRDIARRVSISASQDDSTVNVRKFTVAGLDIMVTSDEKLYLLEVNVDPTAPPADAVTDSFRHHLVGFVHDTMDLVARKRPTNFLTCTQILNSTR